MQCSDKMKTEVGKSRLRQPNEEIPKKIFIHQNEYRTVAEINILCLRPFFMPYLVIDDFQIE